MFSSFNFRARPAFHSADCVGHCLSEAVLSLNPQSARRNAFSAALRKPKNYESILSIPFLFSAFVLAAFIYFNVNVKS
jgi:hypothetical protein